MDNYSEYELRNVSHGLNADGSEQSKHDPYCDCGICAYCNGQEDVDGNPSRSTVTRQPDPRDARIAELEAALRELASAVIEHQEDNLPSTRQRVRNAIADGIHALNPASSEKETK